MEIYNVVGYVFNNINGIIHYIGNHKIQTGLAGLVSLVIGAGAVDCVVATPTTPREHMQRRIETIKGVVAPWFEDGSVQSGLERHVSSQPVLVYPCNEVKFFYPDLEDGISKDKYVSPIGHEITIEGSPQFVDAYFKALNWSEQFPKTHSYINEWINCVIESESHTKRGNVAATHEHKTRTAIISPIVIAANYTGDDYLINLTSALAHESGWIEHRVEFEKTRPHTFYDFRSGYIKANEREIEALEEMGAGERRLKGPKREIQRCIERIARSCIERSFRR